MYMQKVIVLGGAGAAVAIGITLWQTRNTAPAIPNTAPAQVEAAGEVPAVVSRRAAPPQAFKEATVPPARIDAERLADDIDDGDLHGHAGHEQGEIQPLEEPTPSRDAFGADPESETAALAEARATLEALLNDPDPAVKERASALLQAIAVP
jgi:hypothetical protein